MNVEPIAVDSHAQIAAPGHRRLQSLAARPAGAPHAGAGSHRRPARERFPRRAPAAQGNGAAALQATFAVTARGWPAAPAARTRPASTAPAAPPVSLRPAAWRYR